MNFSHRTNFLLISLLIVLNLILRLQPFEHELGIDSFLMRTMINSLTEYGYAKWILHPLSFAGLYPYSYTSSVLFLLSGIQQTTELSMDKVVFVYTAFQTIMGIFTMYLMVNAFFDDDFHKYITIFIFSTSPALVSYTTQTIGTRSLVVILIPLLIYILITKGKVEKKIILIIPIILFLFVTHHLFFFVLPIVIIYIIFSLLYKRKMIHLLIKVIPGNYRYSISALIPIILFTISFSIPFVFKKFLYGGSRYHLPVLEYFRYTGPSVIFFISGLIYLIFKQKKSSNEWRLLLSIVSLTAFVYISTYMKWFFPIFLAPIACIGILNALKAQKRKYIFTLLIIFLITPVTFVGYFQFLQDHPEYYVNERYIEESTYSTGLWIKEFATDNAISNDQWFSYRIFAVSDTTHFFVPFTTIAAIYDFIDTDVSSYKRYPLSSEEFWFSGYDGPDFAEDIWGTLHKNPESISEYGIRYVVENKKAGGRVIWGHASFYSKVIEIASENNLIYDSGNIGIWQLFDR